MHDITQHEFMTTLFPPDLLLRDERPAVTWKDEFTSRETGKLVEYWANRHYREGIVPAGKASYFCVSTVERQRQRKIRRRLEEARTAMVLSVDDLGTKSEYCDVPMSYLLETSAGNYHGGWLLHPYDVSTPAGQAYYDSVLYSLAEAGLNDPGCRSSTRVMRLPGSLHKTGFEARVVEWNPERIWDLEELVEAFDIPMKEPRKSYALKPGKYDVLENVVDPVYAWLVDNWTIYGHNDCWVHIECPWRSTHTDNAQGPSSSSYSPMDYGRGGVGFKCMHGHCVHRGVDDFMAEILRRRNSNV
jgi:hypothetical protein